HARFGHCRVPADRPHDGRSPRRPCGEWRGGQRKTRGQGEGRGDRADPAVSDLRLISMNLLSPVASSGERVKARSTTMRCPYCGCENTQVKDSRPTEENQAIRRRRNCEDCGGRFTTFQRVQLPEITVIKRSGRRVPFDREKLSRSVEVALRKRPIQSERIDRMVSGIVRQLESMGEQEMPSSVIGELVMEALKGLDPVAYVRFASVYRDFP